MLTNLINSYKPQQFLQIFLLLIISYKSHNYYKFFKSSNLSPTGMKFRSILYTINVIIFKFDLSTNTDSTSEIFLISGSHVF